MMTDSMKRQTSLNLLQKLRRQGLPAREEKMESMFDSLTGSDGSDKSDESEQDGEDQTPEYELQSPEQQAKEREKKKNPQLEPGKVERFKKGFLGTK